MTRPEETPAPTPLPGMPPYESQLVEFLLSRIAEDEAAAQRLQDELEREVAENYAGMVDERGPATPERILSAQLWAHFDGQTKSRNFAKGQYLATMAAPSRVLAECAAKRVIVEQAEDATGLDMSVDNDRRVGHRDLGSEPYCGEVILAALASVYADHPDYRQEWSRG